VVLVLLDRAGQKPRGHANSAFFGPYQPVNVTLA
jgi:hypothetical protein